MDRRDAGRVGLELGQAVLVDLRAVHSVGLAPLVNPFQCGQLAVVDRDDHLAADLVRDSLGRAKLFHRLLAGPAVDRLERARLVVDARVEHARVVAGLMMGQLGFLLQHHDAPAGILPRDLIGRGETDNSSANHRNIRFFHHVSVYNQVCSLNRRPFDSIDHTRVAVVAAAKQVKVKRKALVEAWPGSIGPDSTLELEADASIELLNLGRGGKTGSSNSKTSLGNTAEKASTVHTG